MRCTTPRRGPHGRLQLGPGADRERSAQAGFEAHLVKPVDPGLLQRTVAELMSLP